MRIIGRLFVILVGSAWCAAMALLIWAVWRLGDSRVIETRGVTLAFTNELTHSDQVLATIILSALIVPAVLLILTAMFGGYRRSVSAAERVSAGEYQRLESRVTRLEGSPRPVVYAPAETRETVPVMAEPRRRSFFDRFRHHDDRGLKPV